ncbi:unnamed protein product, partial [Polarella glacialis]
MRDDVASMKFMETLSLTGDQQSISYVRHAAVHTTSPKRSTQRQHVQPSASAVHEVSIVRSSEQTGGESRNSLGPGVNPGMSIGLGGPGLAGPGMGLDLGNGMGKGTSSQLLRCIKEFTAPRRRTRSSSWRSNRRQSSLTSSRTNSS